jgi:hypothetical protein
MERARSAQPTQASAGPAQLARTRAGAGGLNRLTDGAQPSEAAGAESVWSALSRPIKSGSTALGRLLPPAARTQSRNPSAARPGAGAHLGASRATRR